jgi:hypothetical protein
MSFTEMAQAPHARYRHAAAVANGKLFLFGGRAVDDNLVTAIDVRDLPCLCHLISVCSARTDLLFVFTCSFQCFTVI